MDTRALSMAGGGGGSGAASAAAAGPVNVWASNLETEFERVRSLAESYKFVAMDTEFPGTVVRPLGSFGSRAEFSYEVRLCARGVPPLRVEGPRSGGGGEEGDATCARRPPRPALAPLARAPRPPLPPLFFTPPPPPPSNHRLQMLRANVEVLRLIQLGLTFLDEDGNPAEDCPMWQFNFRFNLEEDLFAPESIELLRRSGLDFLSHQEKGIEVHHFAELLMTSGLVLCDDIKWLTFHSAYDFGYLLRLLTNAPLPGSWKGCCPRAPPPPQPSSHAPAPLPPPPPPLSPSPLQ
jgi:hypothetical protein